MRVWCTAAGSIAAMSGAERFALQANRTASPANPSTGPRTSRASAACGAVEGAQGCSGIERRLLVGRQSTHCWKALTTAAGLPGCWSGWVNAGAAAAVSRGSGVR